jgi:bacillithiol synthase
VLLRPVVEAAFLPTLAYVAGPGEAAYLAQCTPLFERHGVQRPLVHMRPSFRLIESKVDKVLEKFDLAPEDLARPHHELAGSVLRDDMPASIRQALGALRAGIARGTQDLSVSVAELDPTLKGPVEHVRNQGFQQISEVEKKVVQTLKRQNEIALEQLQKAQIHLYPGGSPQERVLGPWYYLFRYGGELIDRLAGSIG